MHWHEQFSNTTRSPEHHCHRSSLRLCYRSCSVLLLTPALSGSLFAPGVLPMLRRGGIATRVAPLRRPVHGRRSPAAASVPPSGRPLPPPSPRQGGSVPVSVPAARTVAPAPPGVTVEHSSAWALRDLRPQPPPAEESRAAASGSARSAEEGVVSWALRRRVVALCSARSHSCPANSLSRPFRRAQSRRAAGRHRAGAAGRGARCVGRV